MLAKSFNVTHYKYSTKQVAEALGSACAKVVFHSKYAHVLAYSPSKVSRLPTNSFATVYFYYSVIETVFINFVCILNVLCNAHVNVTGIVSLQYCVIDFIWYLT